MKCCALAPGNRPPASEIKELLANMQIQDDRAVTQSLPGIDVLGSRLHPDIEWDHVEKLLSHIQVHLLIDQQQQHNNSTRLSFYEHRYQVLFKVAPKMWPRQYQNCNVMIFRPLWTSWMWCVSVRFLASIFVLIVAPVGS
jgi:hypothetical protein